MPRKTRQADKAYKHLGHGRAQNLDSLMERQQEVMQQQHDEIPFARARPYPNDGAGRLPARGGGSDSSQELAAVLHEMAEVDLELSSNGFALPKGEADSGPDHAHRLSDVQRQLQDVGDDMSHLESKVHTKGARNARAARERQDRQTAEKESERRKLEQERKEWEQRRRERERQQRDIAHQKRVQQNEDEFRRRREELERRKRDLTERTHGQSESSTKTSPQPGAADDDDDELRMLEREIKREEERKVERRALRDGRFENTQAREMERLEEEEREFARQEQAERDRTKREAAEEVRRMEQELAMQEKRAVAASKEERLRMEEEALNRMERRLVKEKREREIQLLKEEEELVLMEERIKREERAKGKLRHDEEIEDQRRREEEELLLLEMRIHEEEVARAEILRLAREEEELRADLELEAAIKEEEERLAKARAARLREEERKREEARNKDARKREIEALEAEIREVEKREEKRRKNIEMQAKLAELKEKAAEEERHAREVKAGRAKRGRLEVDELKKARARREPRDGSDPRHKRGRPGDDDDLDESMLEDLDPDEIDRLLLRERELELEAKIREKKKEKQERKAEKLRRKKELLLATKHELMEKMKDQNEENKRKRVKLEREVEELERRHAATPAAIAKEVAALMRQKKNLLKICELEIQHALLQRFGEVEICEMIRMDIEGLKDMGRIDAEMVPTEWDEEGEYWDTEATVIHPRKVNARNLVKMPEADFRRSRSAIAIRQKPFSYGGVRIAFHLKFRGEQWVAKYFIQAAQRTRLQANIMELNNSAVAGWFADEFNKVCPKRMSKRLKYGEAVVLETIRDGAVCYYMAEPMLEGKFIKFNGNNGYVAEEEGYYTAQAFSHYTFERSQGKVMIVDLQGVVQGNTYFLTDPAIHSHPRSGNFGGTDLGPAGMELFFKSHVCNRICRHLGLKQVGAYVDKSTVVFKG